MSNFVPKPGVKVGGLNPKEQKLRAMLEKAVAAKSAGSAKPASGGQLAANKVKSTQNVAKKVSFQRKAV